MSTINAPQPELETIATGNIINEETVAALNANGNARMLAAATAALSIAGQQNINAISALAEANTDQLADVGEDAIENLRGLAESSADAANANLDEVQTVLDSCILEGTKENSVNQAMIYLHYAVKCAGATDKKHLDVDFFVPGMLEKLQERQRQDERLLPKRGSKRPNFRAFLKKALDRNDASIEFPVKMEKFMCFGLFYVVQCVVLYQQFVYKVVFIVNLRSLRKL